MDPQNALDDLRASLTDAGVDLRFNTTAEAIEHNVAGITGVRLTSGELISCASVVNASGPWCNQLLAPFEFASRWPLEPTRIQVLHLSVPAQMTATMPVCGDFTSGVYFRPQGVGQLIVGSTLEEDEQEAVADPNDYDRFADDDFKMIKMHALKHRVPSLSDRTRVGSYCGLYTVNRADMHPWSAIRQSMASLPPTVSAAMDSSSVRRSARCLPGRSAAVDPASTRPSTSTS